MSIITSDPNKKTIFVNCESDNQYKKVYDAVNKALFQEISFQQCKKCGCMKNCKNGICGRCREEQNKKN